MTQKARPALTTEVASQITNQTAVGSITPTVEGAVFQDIVDSAFNILTDTPATIGALTNASTITAGGPIGASGTVPVITYNAQGQLTAVTTATITPAAIGAPSLTTANTFTQQQNTAVAALTDATSIAWNLNTAQTATVTIAGNRTLSNPTNIVAGGTYILAVKQDTTGGRTLAYGTAYKWPSGTAPTLSTGVSKTDMLTFFSPDGTNMFGTYALDMR